MERRIRALEHRFCPPWQVQLRELATHAAEQVGLEPELVYDEAMLVLREVGERRLAVHDLAGAEGLSADELTRMERQLRSYWQEIA